MGMVCASEGGHGGDAESEALAKIFSPEGLKMQMPREHYTEWEDLGINSETMCVKCNKMGEICELTLHKAEASKSVQAIKFRRLHDRVGDLKELRYLSLQNDHIGDLPDSVGKLQRLRQLYLNFNMISVLPRGFMDLVGLKLLDLSGNRLGVLPDNFGSLIQLEWLSLRNNHLCTLVSSLFQLRRLKFLELSRNDLDELPRDVGRMCALEELLVSECGLHELPNTIGEMEKLQTIDCSKNFIDAVPDMMLTGPPSLETVILFGNPLGQARDQMLSAKQRGLPVQPYVYASVLELTAQGMKNPRPGLASMRGSH